MPAPVAASPPFARSALLKVRPFSTAFGHALDAGVVGRLHALVGEVVALGDGRDVSKQVVLGVNARRDEHTALRHMRRVGGGGLRGVKGRLRVDPASVVRRPVGR